MRRLIGAAISIIRYGRMRSFLLFFVGFCLLQFPDIVWWRFLLSPGSASTSSFSFGAEEPLDSTRFPHLGRDGSFLPFVILPSGWIRVYRVALMAGLCSVASQYSPPGISTCCSFSAWAFILGLLLFLVYFLAVGSIYFYYHARYVSSLSVQRTGTSQPALFSIF